MSSDKQEVSEQFKQNIVRWVKLDDDLKKIRETVKEITEEKKQAEQYILSYLENIGQNDVAISDGKLSRLVSKTPTALKKENIQKAVNEIVKDDNKAHLMTEHILNSRETKQKVTLRRSKIKN
jgi:hypothetical protein